MAGLVDCLDTERKWLVARVIGADESRLHIHYLGWEVKWDEWLPRRDPRIAPYGAHTDGIPARLAATPCHLAARGEELRAVSARTEALLAVAREAVSALPPAPDGDSKKGAAGGGGSTRERGGSAALARLFSPGDYAFLTVGDNYLLLLDVMNALVPAELAASAQSFLALNLDLVIHALQHDDELHLSILNILLLVLCADPLLNRYYREHGHGEAEVRPPEKRGLVLAMPSGGPAGPAGPAGLPSAWLLENVDHFGRRGG
jgi:hypothetical protein